MPGVDLFDKMAFKYDVSRKCRNYTIRVIENVVSFSLTNARAAFCLKNKLDMRKYTVKKFFMDVLRQAYKPLDIIPKISLEIKGLIKLTTCNVKQCKSRTKIPCANLKCKKIACESHSSLICLNCITHRIQPFTPNKNIKKTKSRRKCFCCTTFTNLNCEECGLFACTCHNYKICDMCIFSGRAGVPNFNVHVPIKLPITKNN